MRKTIGRIANGCLAVILAAAMTLEGSIPSMISGDGMTNVYAATVAGDTDPDSTPRTSLGSTLDGTDDPDPDDTDITDSDAGSGDDTGTDNGDTYVDGQDLTDPDDEYSDDLTGDADELTGDETDEDLDDEDDLDDFEDETDRSASRNTSGGVFSLYWDEDDEIFYEYEVLDESAQTAAIVSVYPSTADGNMAYDNDREPIAEYTIPTQIEGYTVVQLGAYAKPGVSGRTNPSGFDLTRNVKKLIIPNTIEDIAYKTRINAASIEEIEFASDSAITELPEYFIDNINMTTPCPVKKITLPDSLTSISDWAFAGCTELTDINFPENIESIGNCAFYCTALNSLDLSGCTQLKTIGEGAFDWSSAARYEYVDSHYTGNIIQDDDEYQTFKGISATELILPDSLESIGSRAFAGDSWAGSIQSGYSWQDTYGVTKLQSVTFGSGLKSIGHHAFAGSRITNLTLPASLETIGEEAFLESAKMTSVTVESGSSLKEIGTSAFINCYSLETVDLSGAVSSEIVLGEGLFMGDQALVDVSLPSNIKKIPDYAFADLDSLTEITLPASVTHIGDYAFMSTSLASINLPAGLESIGSYAFVNCKQLQIDLVIPSTVSYIGVGAFGGWNVEYGDSELIMNGSGIRSLTIAEGSTDLVIANGAFAACTGLNGTDIVLPERVKKLGTGAFHFIQNASFYIENPEMELANVFYDTNDHTEPEEDDYDVEGGFPAYFTLSVGGIGLDGLDFVKIYDPAAVAAELVNYDVYDPTSNQYTVNDAGETVFEGYVCSIPDPWASDDVFDRQILPGSDNGLTLNGSIVYYPNEINEYSESYPGVVPGAGSGISPTLWGYIEAVEGNFNYLMNHNNHTYPYGEYDEEDSIPVLKLENYDYEGGAYTYYPTFAGEGTTGVQKKRTHYKVRFDANGGAFSNYSSAVTPYRYYVKDSIYGWFPHVERTNYQFDGWYTSASGGIKVTTADSVDPDITKLYAHWRDPSSGDDVYDLTFGTGVTGEFYEATGRLVISGSGPMRDYEGENSPLKEKKLAGFVKTIEIGNGITRIGDNAFAECTKLTAVTIPATVTSIGAFAFQGCTSLKNLSRTSQITNIGEYAFQDCSSLTAFSLNSGITVLNDGIFQGCSSLTGISLPGSLTSIGGAVFSGCSSIKNIIIPATVTKIGSGEGTAQAVGGTFAGTGIESITIPDGVTYILGETFKGCDQLTSVTIPDSVTTIYSYAFSSCTSLESITLPSDLTMIANNAFEYCTSLTQITIPESVSDIDDGAFYSCTSLKTVNMSQDYDSSVGIGEEPNAFGACYALETINLDHVTVSNGFGYPLPYVFTFTPTSGTPTTITKLNADYPYTGTLTKTSGVIEQYIGDGDDGKNVTASFNVDTGVLTISGNGAIGGYNNSFLDSENIRDKVRTIVINNGVTAIPQGYFDGCASLESITLNNVTLTEDYTLPFVFYAGGTRMTALDAGASYNKTLTAGSAYTVSYDPQGGTVVFVPTSTAYGVIYSPDITPKTVREGSTYGELPVVIRDGFDFDGWFTAATGGTEVDEDDAVTKTQTIYAQWTGKDITVSYDGNGGSVQSVYATWTSTVGEKYNIPGIEPERDGYTFVGWYTAAVGGERITSDTVVTEPESHTLYAHWSNGSGTIKTVKITLNANGGKLPAGSPSSFTRETGEDYGEMPEPVYAGYNFLGWFTAKTGGERITDDIRVKISKDHTLYAQWELIDITVAYDPEGGVFTSNEGDTDAISGKRIHIKRITDKYGPLPTVIRDGYTFDGWYYTDASGETKLAETTGLLCGEDHTISARWLKNICKVVINGATDEEVGFPDFDRAVSWMSTQKNETSFNVILEEDSKLSDNVTLPSSATKITFTGTLDSGEYSPKTLDFDGHSITYGGTGCLSFTGHMIPVNNNSGRGTIKLTNSRSFPRLEFDLRSVNSTDDSLTVLEGVDINAPSGGVYLTDAVRDEAITFEFLDSNVNARTLYTYHGSYDLAEATLAEMVNSTGEASGGTYTTKLHIHKLNGNGTVINNSNNSHHTGILTIDEMNVQNASIRNLAGSDVRIESAGTSTFKLIQNEPGASITTDNLIMPSNGTIALEPDSTLFIRNNGVLNNILLGQDISGSEVKRTYDGKIIRLADTTLTINGRVDAKHPDENGGMLAIATYEDGGDVIGTEGGTILFTTNIKAFPVELINMVQPASHEKYKSLMQIGSNVFVATEWITVRVVGASGEPEELKKFAKWSDMISYVNGIANKSCEYVIELSEDVTTMENLTIPGAAGKVTFRSVADADEDGNIDAVKLVHLGNLLINTDVTFENIILESHSVNAKTGEDTGVNNAATVTINGRTLEFIDSYALNKYATVTGGGNSLLVLRGNGDSGKTTMPFTVVNAFTVANINVDNYDIISETNAITVANDAYLTNSKLECKTNMTFKNLISCDGNNILSYAEQPNGTLKITGYVNCTDSSKEVTVLGSTGVGTDKAFIYTDAIAIDVKYIRNANVLSDDGTESSGMSSYAMKSYTYNAKNGTYKLAIDYATKPLLTAAMAAPSCFRVADPDVYPGKTWYILRKNGNNMLIDNLKQDTVALYRVAYGSDGKLNDEILGNFITLQDALTEIDRYADPDSAYKVAISGDNDELTSKRKDELASKLSANLTMPKQLRGLTITSMAQSDTSNPEPPARIFMNNALNLNSDLELDNVILADNGSTKLNINLGGYRLSLNNVGFESENENRIGNITGNGVGVENYDKHANTSGLCLRHTNLTVSGNLDKVKYIDMDEGPESDAELDQVTLTVLGKTNVGTIWSYGDTFYGSATYKTSKDKSVVTEVVSNVTINDYIEDTVEDEEEDSNNDPVEPGLHFGLKTLQAGVYENLDTAYLSGIGDISALMAGTSFRLMKAQNADINCVTFIDEGQGRLAKSNGFICYTRSLLPYQLCYTDEYGHPLRLADFATFKDAVDEINKLNVKHDYTIMVFGDDTSDSIDDDPTSSTDDDPYMQTPATLTMPAAKSISSLTICGIDNEIVDFYYTGAAITLTCPTTFEDVNMVRVKTGADKVTYERENSDAPDDYLTATAVKTSGNAITFAGAVTWDTPLTLDGGKNGALTLADASSIVTTDIDMADDTMDATNPSGIYIHGSVTNFGSVSLDDRQEMILRGFKTGKPGTKETYVTPNLSVTNMNILGGRVEVGDFTGTLSEEDVYHPLDKSPATVTITNLTIKGHGSADFSGEMANEAISAHGKLTITNLNLLANDNDGSEVDEGEQTIIAADRDFTIAKGTVVSGTPNAILVSRHNAAKTPVPYLNIQGTVERQAESDRIGVAVRRSVEELKADAEAESQVGYTYASLLTLPDMPVNDTPAKPDLTKRQLLTAASATADCFVPVMDNELTDVDYVYSESYLVKNKTAILAYDAASEARIALISSSQAGNQNVDNMSEDSVATYYSTWAEAVSAIQAYNDTTRYYTIILNDAIGIDYDNDDIPAPVALTMPSKAAGLYVTADQAVITANDNYIYYTGAISLGCPTEFIGVDLNPLASAKKDNKTNIWTITGAKGNITAGANDIVLENVTVGGHFNAIAAPLAKSGSSQLGNISSTTGVITLDSPAFRPDTAVLGGNISSTKGSVVISDNATVAGTISVAGLTIASGKSLNVIGDAKGNATVMVTTLTMNGGAKLIDTKSNGKITITDIINDAAPATEANTIEYGCNAKNVSNLEIKGLISGTNENNLVLDYDCEAQTIKDRSGAKVNLADASKLFIAPKFTTGNVDFRIGTAVPDDVLVKANNAFWLVDSTTEIGKNRVTLALTNDTAKNMAFTGAYLDWNQAVTEINNFNDPEGNYVITTSDTVINDTNMTDGNVRSTLPLPGANKSASLSVMGEKVIPDPDHEGETLTVPTTVRFSGAVTTYGHVEMNRIVLDSQNAKGDAAADFNITMNANKNAYGQEPGLFLNDVTTMADSTSWDTESDEFIGTETPNQTGFIGKITGSKAKTENLHITGNNLRVKGAITNINDVVLRGSDVIAVGGVTAAKLSLLEHDDGTDSNLTALAASTVGTVVAEVSECTIGTARNNKNIPLFTVTGAQDPDPDAQINVRSVDQVGSSDESGSTRYNVITYLDGEDGRGNQTNIGLVIAPRSDALCFYAPTENNGFMYKDASNIVYAGDEDDVPIMLTRYKAGDDGYPEGEYLSEYYAKTYADAIANINSIADPNSAYKITFINTGENETGVKGGALTWPKANTAKSLIVSGTRNSDTDITELKYTGTLKPNAANLKVRLENIVLTEGALSKEVFTPTYAITPDLSGASGVDIIIGSNVNTLKPATPEEKIQNKWALSDNEKDVVGSNLPNETLVFSKVVSNAKYTTNTLGLNGQSVLLRGASTIQNLQLNGQTRLSSTTFALTINGDITDITPVPDENKPPALEIAYCYPDATNKTVGFGASPITINGDINDGARVSLKPYIDDAPDAKVVKYVQPTVAQISAMDIKDVPEKSRNSYRFAAVKKAGADRFDVLATDGRFVDGLRKYNGGLYINSAESLIHLTRKTDDENGEPEVFVSECDFETWDAAVAEINGVADKNSTYVIELRGNVGDLGTNDHPGAPLASLTMPTQAKEVIICTCDSNNPELDEDGNEMHDPEGHTIMAPSQFALITTAKKLTLNCPVTFERGVSIITVAGVKNQTPAYKAINYDIVTGTNCLTYRGFENVITFGGMEFHSDINTITGKGSLVSDNCSVYTAGKIAVNSIYADGEGGIYTLADISATDIDIHHGSMITADKNITVTNLYMGGKPDPDPNVHDHDGGTVLASSGDITVTSAFVDDGEVLAQNITFKTILDGEHARINAGMNKFGDPITGTGVGGKITVNNLNLHGNNEMEVKQDKNGKSQLVINGTVTGEAIDIYENNVKVGTDEPHVTVSVYYNDRSNYVQFYDGLILLTAPKAEATWFIPAGSYEYPEWDEENNRERVDEEGQPIMITVPRMGWWADGYTVYKTGSTICYGQSKNMNVRLISLAHSEDDPDNLEADEIVGFSEFATFDEAVKEIGNLNRRYQIGKTSYYEDYIIELLEDVELVNAKGAYVAPTLPSAVDVLTIRSRVPMKYDPDTHEECIDTNDNRTMVLSYTGNLTLKSNLILQDIILDQEGKIGNAVLGNFVLTLNDAYSNADYEVDETAPGYVEDDPETYVYNVSYEPLEFGSITGSNKTGRLVVDEFTTHDASFKYNHSDADPYTVVAGSVSGLYAVDIWDNAMLDVGGALNVGRIRYMTGFAPEDKDDLQAALGSDYKPSVGTVACAGGLTATQIQIYNTDPEMHLANLMVDSTKANKITGIANKAKQSITIAGWDADLAAFDETVMITDADTDDTGAIPAGIISLYALNETADTGSRMLNVKGLDAQQLRAFEVFDGHVDVDSEGEAVPASRQRSFYRNTDNIVMGNILP